MAQQALSEKLFIIRDHMLKIEQDLVNPDMKAPANKAIGALNEMITIQKQKEEKVQRQMQRDKEDSTNV